MNQIQLEWLGLRWLGSSDNSSTNNLWYTSIMTNALNRIEPKYFVSFQVANNPKKQSSDRKGSSHSKSFASYNNVPLKINQQVKVLHKTNHQKTFGYTERAQRSNTLEILLFVSYKCLNWYEARINASPAVYHTKSCHSIGRVKKAKYSALSNNKFISCVSASIWWFFFALSLCVCVVAFVVYRLTCCLACSSLCLSDLIYMVLTCENVQCIAVQLFSSVVIQQRRAAK